MAQPASRRMAREGARETAQKIAQEIGRDPAFAREPSTDAARSEGARAALQARDTARERTAAERADARRLSQANRGLRMILVAGVIVVLLSWGGALGSQYIQLMQIEALLAADQDALRVMCAVDPPDERQLGRMHICETVAGAAGPTGLAN